MSKLPVERYFLLPREGGGSVILTQNRIEEVPLTAEEETSRTQEVTAKRPKAGTAGRKGSKKTEQLLKGKELQEMLKKVLKKRELLDEMEGLSEAKRTSHRIHPARLPHRPAFGIRKRKAEELEGISFETKLKISLFDAMCRLIPRDLVPYGHLSDVVETGDMGLTTNHSALTQDVLGWLLGGHLKPEIGLIPRCYYRDVMEELGTGTGLPSLIFQLIYQNSGGGRYTFLYPRSGELFSLIFQWKKAARGWFSAAGLNNALDKVPDSMRLDPIGTGYKCVLVMEYEPHPGVYYVGTRPDSELSLELPDRDSGYYYITDPVAGRPAYLLLYQDKLSLQLSKFARNTIFNSTFIFTGISVVVILHALLSLGLLNYASTKNIK